MGNVPPFQITDTDHFTTGEVACHAFDPFWQQRAAFFKDRHRCPFVYGEFARWRCAKDPALAALQRRGLGVKACSYRHAIEGVADNPRPATGGDNGLDARPAGDVGSL